MKKLVLISILLGIFVGVNAQSSMTVNVTGIDSPKGDLYVALYDSNVPFLSNKAIAGKIIEIDSNSMTIIFEDVENGRHAIAIYQDGNKNGKLDLGEWGIPQEKYGFSNNVDPALIKRAPNFDECSFDVNGNTSVTINLVSAVK
ncbi:uncharacterized protein (DUF2141 family) [Dysgonomonas hofstadii]|uniref:Uncharacterized protein (DUF2141 family) n=1 Tax=Dysgonomonas hofstadii TaxID=637886 RepID=A0A840CMA0_9BACT|nr:DUF2141 domain-containing protein [Dysgonomonas hofstadii]MBB4037120.1 uncharacterized protein (DUF2141 family) [Dysgonomonas hofstadii]